MDVKDTNDMLSAQLGHRIYRLSPGGCVYDPRLCFFLVGQGCGRYSMLVNSCGTFGKFVW